MSESVKRVALGMLVIVAVVGAWGVPNDAGLIPRAFLTVGACLVQLMVCLPWDEPAVKGGGGRP